MRDALIVGNWKMHGTRAFARELATAIVAETRALHEVEIALCPPAVLIPAVMEAVAGSSIRCGGQDVSEFEAGAYTGEIASAMLVDQGCRYVIVGHSERRQHYGDTAVRVAAKMACAHANGLTPILCLGETLAQRQAGQTEAAIAAQLAPILALDGAAQVLGASAIAYEPVWAIGTGETATPTQAEAVHAYIRQRLHACQGESAEQVRILYGGSVKAANAADLFAMPNVNGGLVGGASLEAADFAQICAAATP